MRTSRSLANSRTHAITSSMALAGVAGVVAIAVGVGSHHAASGALGTSAGGSESSDDSSGVSSGPSSSDPGNSWNTSGTTVLPGAGSSVARSSGS